MFPNIENVDLDFIYDDADSPENELAELYSYSEEQDILNNRSAFEYVMVKHGFPGQWMKMDDHQKKRIYELMLDGIEMADDCIRWKHLQALFYLLQGVFGECESIDQQARIARQNVLTAYRQGFFPLLIQQMVWELESSPPPQTSTQPGNNNPNYRKSSYFGDSFKLRTIVGMVYTFVEVMRVDTEFDTREDLFTRKNFAEELGQPMGEANDNLVAIVIFQSINRFSNNSAPHIPIKKVLLLLWKVLLVTLGGSHQLRYLKNLYRTEAGLPPEPDDTLEVVKTMRASTPPINANEALEAQSQRKLNKPLKRQMFVKQSSVGGEENNELDVNEDDLISDEGLGPSESESDTDIDKIPSTVGDEVPLPIGATTEEDEKVDMGGRPASPRPETPNRGSLARVLPEDGEPFLQGSKKLPWVQKVRNKDIDNFFDYSRNKFIGYLLPNDRTTTAGFPEPIIESITVLKSHVYVSLTEVQTKKEDDLLRYPLTMSEEGLASLTSPMEVLYTAMLPNLSQYVISILKILLAAAPTSRPKGESINIVSDVLPEEIPSSVVQSMKLGIDVNRHKEIIIKAISGVLLLLLKHTKVNHVYQFEYISQQLMFANCIPLVLKFFNQNVVQYVSSRNTISVIDFPACVIGEQPELTPENLDMGDPSSSLFCWRNVYSCINLLRVLNKLTKWKHSRIMMLVVFKSAPILKRALKLRHAMLQLYVLKLLKMQAKYLGRQWRKSNMKTMSAIYQKVRHRITDDWAYGNDVESRPWDFQAEEFALQASINRFHNRRYGRDGGSSTHPGIDPTNPESVADMDLLDTVDNNILSVLSREVTLPRTFKVNYEKWLEREVFNTQTDWDLLLTSTDTSSM